MNIPDEVYLIPSDTELTSTPIEYYTPEEIAVCVLSVLQVNTVVDPDDQETCEEKRERLERGSSSSEKKRYLTDLLLFKVEQLNF
jgi:hypothetical protein